MRSVFAVIRTLSLGLLLIGGAAVFLLYSDLGSRHGQPIEAKPSDASRVWNVALIQHASQSTIDDGIDGLIEVLRSRGYVDGGRIKLKRYNAESDLGTAHAIAREVTAGTNDLLITVTTMSLQTVARANEAGPRTRHVFGMVTDPYGAGVGINRENHLDHPPYLTGYGNLQPIAKAFAMAREMRPELTRVGLIWNPTEANSVAQTTIARRVTAELGITLVEANADTPSAGAEAAGSLVARGVEAIWLSGDVTAILSADAIIAIARRAKIPVFSVVPPSADKGTLFDIGADFTEVGRNIGRLAADVLDGRNIAEIPVENVVPEIVLVNHLALKGLKDRWRISGSIDARANVVIDERGRHKR